MQVIKEFEAKELAKGLTLELTIKDYNQWRTRLWLAEKLVMLACWIAWINYKFVSSGNKEECG